MGIVLAYLDVCRELEAAKNGSEGQEATTLLGCCLWGCLKWCWLYKAMCFCCILFRKKFLKENLKWPMCNLTPCKLAFLNSQLTSLQSFHKVEKQEKRNSLLKTVLLFQSGHHSNCKQIRKYPSIEQHNPHRRLSITNSSRLDVTKVPNSNLNKW